MNKVASYLQSHLSGEVVVNESVLRHFSTDASVLSIKPQLVVYPRTTNDIRKVARFAWQLAERGHGLSVTARGNGSDMTGASLGNGMIVAMAAHMNRILEIDTKQKLVRLQPGLNFKSLQETLNTHGLFLPPQPESYDYSTVGGAIANNSRSLRSYVYGSMMDWVDQLEVVLANGEAIQTGALSKKEVSKKLGLTTLEGELYRAVDAVLNDGDEVLSSYYGSVRSAVDALGVDLTRVQQKGGGLDLTSLFIGTQGIFGIVTEAIVRVSAYQPDASMIVVGFRSIEDAYDASQKISNLNPSMVDVVDGDFYDFAAKHHGFELPDELKIDGGTPAAVLFIETNEPSDKKRSKFIKKATKALGEYSEAIVSSDDFDEREKLWSYRQVTALMANYTQGGKAATTAVSSVSVPSETLHQFISSTKELATKHRVEISVWAHMQSGIVKLLPQFDLSKLGDRQRLLKFLDEYYGSVVKLQGSICAEGNAGRLQAPYMKKQIPTEALELFAQIKKACDPHNILNTGTLVDVDSKKLVDNLRKDFSLDHFADYMPRL